MAYLEGVGDEVLVAVALLVVLLASLLLWTLSQGTTHTTTTTTSSVPSPTHPLLQSPGVEERRSPSREPDLNPSPDEGATEEAEGGSGLHRDTIETVTGDVPDDNSTVRDCTQNQDSEVNCENESADVRQRRLDFFQKSCGAEDACTQRPVGAGESVANGPIQNSAVDSSQPPEGEEGTSRNLNPEVIQIRLKYLDDTVRIVQSPPSQIIQQFKRIHFADDLANDRFVRLISTGYVLEDTRSLESYGLVEGSVIHVQVQTNQGSSQQRPTGGGSQGESDLDIGQFLSPILGVALLCVWIMHFQYKEYFSTTSTVALLVLSVLFLTVVWGQHGGPRTANSPLQ